MNRVIKNLVSVESEDLLGLKTKTFVVLGGTQAIGDTEKKKKTE